MGVIPPRTRLRVSIVMALTRWSDYVARNMCTGPFQCDPPEMLTIECRFGHQVWELREDFGPGYRVYYARNGKTVVLLLCGGDKRSQGSDIGRAVEYWKNYQQRNAR